MLNKKCLQVLGAFILNGPDPKALDAVLKQLSDPNRKNPQELDKAIIGIHSFKLLLVL